MSPLTTPAALAAMADELPDHDALIGNDRTFTFTQLRETVRAAAAAMIAIGVRAGDRVAIWSPNSWHWVVAALGAHHTGAVVVPINPAYTAPEAADILGRTGARLLLAGEEITGADRASSLDHDGLPALAHVIGIPVGGDGAWDFLAGPRAPESEVDARVGGLTPDSISEILFTSGTTGRSKGAMGTHRQSLRNAADWADCAEMTAADRYLCVNPLAFTFGYRSGMIVCLARGATLVPLRSFDPEQALQVIAEQRITVMPGPPALFHALLDHPTRTQSDLRSLRVAVLGGASVPESLVERVRGELGFRELLHAYGLTEATAAATMCRCGDDTTTVATTSGRPIAGFEVRIDSAGADGIGQVLLRGPGVMVGYLDDPVATAEAVDEQGWLHTGDLGILDAAGNLRITGRLTDMYVCGGANVYPAEVEQALGLIDGVADAAVIGVPHDRLGEVGRAYVVPRPGADLDVPQIIAGLRSRLAGFKLPRSVVVVDRLPRNASGKILKTALRDMADFPAAAVTPRGLGGSPVGTAENWVADAWQLLLNIARPGRRDHFTDLGGDSLAAIEFSTMLKTRFDAEMPLDTLAGLPTIADIVAALAPGSGRPRQSVVRLRAGDTGPVCLLIPGIGGHAWTFAATAAAMTADCELWAMSLMELREGSPEQMRQRVNTAALDALRSAAHAGRPIMVGGYSFGALIATDLVGWLTEQGIPVTLLLIDPDPLESGDFRWDPISLHKPAGILTIEPGSPAARRLAKQVGATAELLRRAYLAVPVRLPPVPVAWLQTTAMANQHRGAATVFGVPAADIERTVVELGHIDLIRIPHVTHLAGWLDRQLAERTDRQ